MSSFNPFISKIENIDDIFDIESDCIESKYKNKCLCTSKR